MPSTRSLALALVASSAAFASTDAFWLIPGSTHDDSLAQRAAEQSAAQRLRASLVENYAALSDRVAGAAQAIPSVGAPKAAVTPSLVDDLLRGLEEVTTDVGYAASRAKGTLGRGIYMRQNEDAYLLSMDVPGLHTREVSITADKGTLRIKGERKCPHVVGSNKPDTLCIPRAYDASFTFPSDADEEKADGKLDAGVVRVFVPKIKNQARGVGRVIKVTGDAADWVYAESGAKTVVDATADGVNSAAASVAAAAAEASATAAGVYNSAAGTVNRVVDNVVGSVYGAADSARIAGNDAAASAKSIGHAATASVKSAGSAATDAGAHATNVAAASASSIASAASRSAHSAASQASATGAAATDSIKKAAATETANPSFVDRIHEQYVKPIKEHIYPTGSAEGSVHINKEL